MHKTATHHHTTDDALPNKLTLLPPQLSPNSQLPLVFIPNPCFPTTVHNNICLSDRHENINPKLQQQQERESHTHTHTHSLSLSLSHSRLTSLSSKSKSFLFT
ncbi:hypothetical protein L6452_04730 [Arctium lappa]|uniref:Uncharacterized protein n=1 Tax=Arctium lappa TaxID=4217 RepID=A0ACB9EFG9_ARCLA|nr:hypothetical protein L6452_04730 [Arctium lappa]